MTRHAYGATGAACAATRSLTVGLWALLGTEADSASLTVPGPSADSAAQQDDKEIQEMFIEGRDFDHVCDGWDEEWGNCEGLPDCGPCQPSDCVWGQWGEWRYAGGCTGLNLRERRIEVRANECGQPCEGAKEESKSYVLDKCRPHGADCLLSAWSHWSSCSSEKDQSIRERSVQRKPESGGLPCSGSLRETRPCGGPKKTDCDFGPWQEWTSCSATCGEGRHTRMRRVDVEARNGGATCWDMLLQTAVCGGRPCAGQDCQQTSWTEWTACHEGRTQRFRSRQILQAPKGSGKACEKDLMETLGCPRPTPVDCVVSTWGAWSRCDKACGGGQRYRERQVEASAKDGGKCQSISLKDTESCGTQPCHSDTPQDCILTQWDAWSSCSASCGEGSRTRTRKVLSFATFGGDGCQGALAELGHCGGSACEAADCLWSSWKEWSPCSLTCGGGTKHRIRQVAVLPSSGGKPCDAKDKGQVAPCSLAPCGEGCVDGRWGQWQEWTECSGTCQTAYKSRRRSVDIHPNFCGEAPVGLREEFAQCTSLEPCSERRDCQVSEWGEWSQCSAHCFGIRERNRYIAEFAASGGKACEHGLKQIEPCNPGAGQRTPSDCADKPREDCVMDEWASWSRCSVPCGGGQRSTRRNMLAPSQNGGKPCASDLVITAACNTQPCEEEGCRDCQWAEWSEWSACSKCGGQKYRHRAIAVMPNHCGQRCDLKTVKEMTDCPKSCEEVHFCAWTEWSSPRCSNHCGNATTMRNRALGFVKGAQSYLFIGTEGAKCAGTQLNQSLCPFTAPCKVCNPIHCEFDSWSEWAEPTCQGLCERSRVIARMNNECGEPCSGSLLETKQCPVAPCNTPKDCVLSAWQPWTACRQSEQSGQKYRAREIEQKPAHGGSPCKGVLSETMGCDVNDHPQSCLFGNWEEWSACSLSCGIGWHVRSREIVQPELRGGFPCQGNLKELQHCKAWDDAACQKQGKVDCVLGDWGDWSLCGGDGQRYRDRRVSVPATHDGEPCEGCVHETETCALEKVDCRYSEWTEWDRCDKACGKGQTHRQRQIHRFPENGGRTCPYELMQTKGCELQRCIVANCTVSDWSDWGSCKESCGPGTQERKRSITRLRDAGGRGFTGMLGEARECPDNPACNAQDCEWNDWEPWSGCSASCDGGQKTRQRHIRTYPQKGGKSCNAEELAEVEPCNTQPCGEERCENGAWFEWSAWSPCSATCDGGTTFRRRKIAKMANECGCPPHGNESETAFCNVDTPCGDSVDCKFSMWTEWFACSATCDGVKRRSRKIAIYGKGNGAYCTGPLKQTWPCNPSPGQDPPEGCVQGPRRDCELSDWSEWGICPVTCGGGEHMRSRAITQHPANGGKPCNHALSEIRECARSECGGPAATDCEFGEWEEWGECDKCSGERMRLRSILSFPVNGGKECEPAAIKEVGKCPRRCHHQKFCEWDEWGKWTQCTVTCGKGGKRRRRRHLHLTDFAQAKVSEALERDYETLRGRAAVLEAGHRSEVLASFAAGFFTVLLALGGIRAHSAVRARRHGMESYQHLLNLQEGGGSLRQAIDLETE